MRTIKSITLAIMLIGCTIGWIAQGAQADQQQKDVLTVLVTPEHRAMANDWATAFNKEANTTIEVLELQKHQLIGETQLALLPASNLENGELKAGWKMVIGRDIAVPIINAKNPYLKLIYENGISEENFVNLLENPGNANWQVLARTNEKVPIQFVAANQAFIKSAIGFSEENLKSSNEVVAAVLANKYAIGFVALNQLQQIQKSTLSDGVALLPFDTNKSGKLEATENIYSNLDDLSRGVWIGKYPKSLYQNIYLVAANTPATEAQNDFLKWVITAGQPAVASNGYNMLLANEVPAKLSKIDKNIPVNFEPEQAMSKTGLFILVLSIAIILIIAIEYSIRRKKRKALKPETMQAEREAITAQGMQLPQGMYFDNSHTWAFMEKDGSVRIGIDDFLPKVTGEISKIMLKDQDAKIRKGEEIITLVQNGKKLQINAPVSGTIKAYNATLLQNANLLNSEPYENGWIYLIEPLNWKRELGFLQLADQYSTWIANEINRLKDFLANALTKDKTEYATLVLQDGGELCESTLQHLGPEIWEEFQNQFLENK